MIYVNVYGTPPAPGEYRTIQFLVMDDSIKAALLKRGWRFRSENVYERYQRKHKVARKQ